METFSALLAIFAGNSLVPGEFSTKSPVTRSFDIYFDLRPNKRLNKQSWGWWFETPSCPLWRHRNVIQEQIPYHIVIRMISNSTPRCSLFLITEISYTSMDRAWITNNINVKQWDVKIHPDFFLWILCAISNVSNQCPKTMRKFRL